MTTKKSPAPSHTSSKTTETTAPRAPKGRSAASQKSTRAQPSASEGGQQGLKDGAPEQGDGIRLNVYLQEQGAASRRKSDTMIQQGRVQVNGVVVTQLGTKIPADSEVKLDGKVLRPASGKKTVLMLHKPDLCLTSRSDTQGRRTVFDLPALNKLAPGCQAVGRLDYRSEGLLLLTNDGDLAYALTHPRFSVEKTYAVLVADSVNAEDIDRLRKGVQLDDGFAKPVAVRLGNKERLGGSRGQWVEIIVAEGRNRLIRRMMEVVGLNVIRLVRLAIGDLRLPEKLGPGQVVPVVGAELSYLNRIKLDMIEERERPRPASERPFLSDADKLKRKLKRKLSLNDAEYAEERQRRSAEAGSHKRTRRESLDADSLPPETPLTVDSPTSAAAAASVPRAKAPSPRATPAAARAPSRPQAPAKDGARPHTAKPKPATAKPATAAASPEPTSQARRRVRRSEDAESKQKTPRARDVARRKQKGR
jgi:23S rRNA pseudouridine2605 synthase